MGQEPDRPLPPLERVSRRKARPLNLQLRELFFCHLNIVERTFLFDRLEDVVGNLSDGDDAVLLIANDLNASFVGLNENANLRNNELTGDLARIQDEDKKYTSGGNGQTLIPRSGTTAHQLQD